MSNVVAADGSVASIAINSATYVTLFSKTFHLAAGDFAVIDFELGLLNNSGGNRAYDFNFNFAGVDHAYNEGAIVSNASNQYRKNYRVLIAVLSTGSAAIIFEAIGSTSPTADNAVSVWANAQEPAYWLLLATDVTGDQTFAFKIKSDNTGATQTAIVRAFNIYRIPG